MLLDGLQSDRLQYRSLREDDFEALMPFFESEEAMQFFFPNLPPEKFCRYWINKQLDRYDKYNLGLCALIDIKSKKLIGQCGLLNQELDKIEELEIGYSLLPAYWGKGYATESSNTMKEFAFNNNLVDSLISIIHINNINSQKVAVRNGMEIYKTTKHHDLNVHIYRIHKSKWIQLSNI